MRIAIQKSFALGLLLITQLVANTAPYFTDTIADTILTEDAGWSVWLNEYATDDDEDVLSYALAEGAPDSMVINPSSGRITWTPHNEDVGVHEVTAIVSDGSLSDYLTFYLYVNNINDEPYWVNVTDDTVRVDEDDDLEAGVTANDNDLMHGDHIIYRIIHGPDSLNIDSTAGTITWTPHNGDVDSYTVTVRAQDDSLAAVDWTFRLEVINTKVEFSNAPPTEAHEDQDYQFDLASTDENQGNTVYYFKTEYQPQWLGIDQYTGELSGTPDNRYVGPDSVIIIVDDGNGLYDTLAYELTVINAKPEITSPTLMSASEDVAFAADIDADDEGLGVTSYRFLEEIEPTPDWLSLDDAADGTISGTPTNAHVGSNSFFLEFDDGKGLKDTAQFVINVSNLRAEIDSSGLIYDISEDQAYSKVFTSTDDGQGNVTYHGIGLPDWLSIGLNSGELQGTPNNQDVGDFPMSVYVWDGNENGRDTVSFSIHVENRLPQLLSTAETAATEDSPYYYDIEYDDEDQGAVYSWAIQPSWLTLDSQTGELNGTPDNSDVGDTTVSVSIDDGNGGIVAHTFSVSVTNVPPVFAAQADTSITQDSLLTIDLYTDDEGDPLVIYEILAAPNGLEIGDNNGLMQWTPDNSQIGNNDFEIKATDNHGKADTITFSVDVINLDPIIESEAITTAEEDVEYEYDVECNEEGIGNVTYSLDTDQGWLSITEDEGVITGTPSNSDVGEHNITVRVEDGNGGSATQTFTLSVENLTPSITTATLDPATEDSLYQFDISVYPPSQGDLTFSIEGDKPDWISINALNGRLSGTPDNSDVTGDAKDSITVHVEDGNGGIGEKKLELIVDNSLPLFTTTDDITITEDSDLDVDINTNDEGDEGPNASGYNLVAAPAWVSINATTGILSGTPRDDDVESTTLTIRYRDGNNGQEQLSVTLTVENNPPTITSVNPPTTVTEDADYTFQFISDDDDWGYVTYSSLDELPYNLSLSSAGELAGTLYNRSVGTHDIDIVATDKNDGKDTLSYSLTVTNNPPEISGPSVTESAYSTSGDTIFVNEDLLYQFDFSSTDESDGAATQYTFSSKPAWLTVISSITGILRGTPTNLHVGLDSIEAVFADGKGGSDTKKVYVQVQNKSLTFVDPPETVTATEDVLFSLDLDTDDDGQGTITYSVIDGDPGWFTLDAETGEISGTPDNDDVTEGVTVTFQATDGKGGSDTQNIVFVVENTNDDPVWDSVPSGTVQTAEDALYSVTVAASDVDVGDELTYSLSAAPAGMTIDDESGEISWTPDNAAVATHSIVVNVTDGTETISHSWSLEVTNSASPIAAPLPSDFSPSMAVSAVADTFYIKEDTVYTLDLDAPDEGVGSAEVIGYSFNEFANPGWITLTDSESGHIALQPTNGDVGLDSFSVFFKDQPGSRDTALVYLRIENVAPQILTAGPFAATEGEAFRDTLESSDDGDGTITWSFVSGKPDWLDFADAPAGILSGTPDNADVVSDASFRVRVSDGNGGTAEKDFDYSVANVNSPPEWDYFPGDTVSIPEDSLYSVTITASDADAGDAIAYALQSAPTGMTINSSSGLIQWTPDNSLVGSHTVYAYAIDQSDDSTQADWIITVNNLNDEPTWITVPGGTIETDEDAQYSTTIEANDIDAGDNVTYSLTDSPAGMTISASSGLIEWTPDNDDVDDHSVTARATDDSAAFVEATWTVRVLNTNDDPVWDSVPSGTVQTAEDALYSVTVTASDVDVGDELSYSLSAPPAGMSIDENSGDISWTPDNAAVATHSIVVNVTDGTETISSSWSLEVTNSASPIAAPLTSDFSPSAAVSAVVDSFYIKEDTVYSLDLDAPDEGVGSTEVIGYSFDEFANPDWITLTDSETGQVTLQPTNGDVGLDSFKVYFKDQPGSRDTLVVYLRVENVAPQILTAGPFIATEGEAFRDTLESSDDGDGTITWSFVSGKPGWLDFADASAGILSGTPDNDDVISDASFRVRVSDGNGGTAEKDFDYSVVNVNSPPEWVTVPAETETVSEDSLFSFTVQANDADFGDQVRYSLASPPSGMTINSTSGQIDWTPDNSQVGSIGVMVRAIDNSDDTTSYNWTMQVDNSPSAILAVQTSDFQPTGTVTATADTFFIWEDSVYTLDLEASDEGAGENPYYLTSGLSNPDWVALNDAETGIMQLMPINKDVGLDSFRVVFQDQPESRDTAKIYIKVKNSVPALLAAGPFEATQDQSFSYDIESTDEDEFTTFSFVGDYPAWLSIDDSDGTLSGTPDNEAVGTTIFTVRINDGHGGSAQRQYSVTVTNTNDPPTITSTALTTAIEDSLYEYTVVADDPDGDELTYSLVTFPTGMSIDSASGVIQWTPDNGHVGTNPSVKVTASDTASETASQTWTITISNSLPTFLTADTLFEALEDEEFSVDLSADDEGQGSAQYAAISLPEWLSLENSVTGELRGTPTNEYVTVVDTVWIDFDDANGGHDTLKVPLEVTNIAPTFTTRNDTTVQEDSLCVIDLDCDDEFAGGVTYTALNPLPDWLTLNASDGQLTGTPENGDVGAHMISVRARDAANGSSDISFQLAVENTPPQFTGSPLTTIAEDSLYEYTCTVSDSEGVITFQLIEDGGWLTINTATGKLSGTPRNNHVGSHTVRVGVNDGNAGRDTLEFVITVENTPPRITTVPETTTQEDILYSVDFNCTDENYGAMIYTALQKPEWLTLNAATGLLRGTPLNQHVAPAATVEIAVADGKGKSDTLLYSLEVTNRPPTITTIFDDTSLVEDDYFSFDIDSDDEGQGGTVYRFVSAPPEWLQLDSLTGVLYGTPLNHHVNSATGYQLMVDDAQGGSDNSVIFITVTNNPPVFTSTLEDSLAEENQLFSYDADTDDEGQGEVQYALIGAPAWMTIDDSSGLITGIPDNDDVDTAIVMIRFDDTNGASVDQLLQVIVTNVNDPPLITTATDRDTLAEDILWSLTFTAQDSDEVYGDEIGFLIAQQPTGLTVDANSGQVQWTPVNADVGDTSFYLIAEDQSGRRDSLLFGLHVLNVNDVPWITQQVDTTAIEDSLFQMIVRATDVDADDTLHYELIVAPPAMTIDDSSGLIQWLPGNADIGVWEVQTRVYDLSLAAADSDTFSVTVQNANDPPLLTKATRSADIYEDSLFIMQFTAADPDSAYGDSLRFELSDAPAMMQIDTALGEISWTPQNADVGADSFIVWVFDRSGASDSLQFSLTILNTNDPPLLAGIADTIAYEDSLFEVSPLFTEVDVGDTVTFSLISAPDSMTLDSLDGTFSWRPNNDDREQQFEIIYQLSDLSQTSDLDTFTVFVHDVNDPPLLSGLPMIRIPEDSSQVVYFSSWADSVLDVDHPDSLLSWDLLGFRYFTNYTLTEDSVVLETDPVWNGIDTTEVVVSDGELSDTAYLTVEIIPVNDYPLISATFPDTIRFPEDDTTTLNLNDYVFDEDNDTLELNWTITPVESEEESQTKGTVIDKQKFFPHQLLLVRQSPHGFALANGAGDSINVDIDPATNIATFYAQPNFYIEGYDFIFLVDDSTGQTGWGSDQKQVTIQVQPANDPPLLSVLPQLSTPEDSVLFYPFSDWYPYVSDIDDDDSTLSWTVLDGSHTLAEMSGDSVLLIPSENWFGLDTLSVIASDGILADTSDLVLQVMAVNDLPRFDSPGDITIVEDSTFQIDLDDYIFDVETPDSDLTLEAQRQSINGTQQIVSPEKSDVVGLKSGKHHRRRVIGTITSAANPADSIVIEIDDHTHVATIYGPANYFCNPQPYVFYVYDDSSAYDSALINITIEPVNDPPVLAAIPALEFPEDSSLEISIAQWDSLVTDVEDDDDDLGWQFSAEADLGIVYNSLRRSLRLSAAPNWNGNTTLTAMVFDRDSLSDTTVISVKVIEVNDPPVIDSALYVLTFDQKDTLSRRLDRFVSDIDHAVDALDWRFEQGGRIHWDHSDTSRTLRLWSDPDWFGRDTLIALVSDPANGADTQAIVITVTDTTRPDFEFAIHQNRLASKYVEIDVYPSEVLGLNPVVTTDGDTLRVTPKVAAGDSSTYYNTTYLIEKTGSVLIRADGLDRAGNAGWQEYRIGVARISRDEGGTLSDPDSILSFLFESNSIPQDLCALFLPYEAGVRSDTALGKLLAKSTAGVGVSKEVDFKIPLNRLQRKARIMFSLEKMEFLQQEAEFLGIYYRQNDRWQYLTTYTSREKGTYWAYSDRPGVYQIRVDYANPTVVLPEEISVDQNYPNPFNSLTTIKYTIGAGGFQTFEEAFRELVPRPVKIKVYNLLGQEVVTLVNEPQLPGFYSITWNGKNRSGRPVSTGLYIYQVIIGDRAFHKKLTVLK